MPTVQAKWDTLGDRLQWAINQQPADGRKKGLRMFERAMRARAMRLQGGITGATLPSITAYLNNKAEPSRRFCEVAGAALNIRPAWLLFGPPTHPFPNDAHENAAAVSGASQPLAGDWKRTHALQLKHAILKAIGAPQPVPSRAYWLSPAEGGIELPKREPEPEPVPHWLAPLGEVWLRLYFRDTLGDPVAVLTAAHDGDESAQRDAERRVGKALRGPLDALGVEAAQMHEEALGDYLSAMVPALFALIAERSRQGARRLAASRHDEDPKGAAPRARRAPKAKSTLTKRSK